VIDVLTDVSSTLASLYKPTKSVLDKIQADLELLTTYLVKERVPKLVQTMLSQVQDMYSQHAVQPNKNSTKQAIRKLQATI